MISWYFYYCESCFTVVESNCEGGRMDGWMERMNEQSKLVSMNIVHKRQLNQSQEL